MDAPLLNKITRYFESKPVKKVWLFGSYSRNEETADSDIDLLVSYDDSANVSLFTIGGMYMDLCRITGRNVDLVEDGTLEPYAVESVNRDKKLIYERAS
ncbi:MAG: nucleotidyltransferase domain-containing protein [Salinivirgaceae bacterium]|nr:nucleotidyltransferase domain-containing protein [Salinivirgaceae bacterium]